ncbi:MAG: glutamate-cysteine ligase family protein, partial [Planctomycetota bacterium]
IRRIGVEQELFLVDRHWRAAPVAGQVLETIGDDHFTTELAKFNLEFNCDPLKFGGGCLGELEGQMNDLLAKARAGARAHDTEVMMTGILPTLTRSDLDLSNMSDRPRYHELNEAFGRERGDDYNFRIRGIDELSFKHSSVMLEAANTSFQIHFQVAPQEFARLYNVAQAALGPVLAVSANSPLLFRHRLWAETRIALFQQSVDTRKAGMHVRTIEPRVSFGTDWIDESVLEIFREDVSRFKVLLGTAIEEDPFERLAAGECPKLQALLLHNSTVYRWNRPCYGITNGKPHLRIENRVIPAGPSIRDEVANAAFWFGLMAGLVEAHPDIRESFRFDDAKNNFVAASRHGLDARLNWFNGKTVTADQLVLEELVPLAKDALRRSGLSADQVAEYLEVIEERVRRRRTGSRWILDSLASMGRRPDNKNEPFVAVTAATHRWQQTDKPVHEWDLAGIDESGGIKSNFLRIEQFMTTDLITVHDEESIDLVANLMDWKRIRHVPVEDSHQRLVGIVSYRRLIRYLARRENESSPGDLSSKPISGIMKRDPIHVAPELSALEAIGLMRQHGISCLPVVSGDQLVGIVTETDFTRIAGQLLEEYLSE